MPRPMPRGPLASTTVREKRNRRLGWTAALAELIDNSVGNSATQVDVELSRTEVLVRDNGIGCTPEMFAALVSLGWHQEDDDVKNTVSRYGVGAKDAMLWFGGPTAVASVRDSLFQWTEVDWDAFQDTFDYDEPVEGDIAHGEAIRLGLNGSGVVVHAPAHTRKLAENHFTEVHASLCKLFWAAVETGVTINVTYTPNRKKPRKAMLGGPLTGKPMPEMIASSAIDRQVELEDGRTIRLVGGVVAPSVRLSSPGFEYIYGHRVVIESGGVGAGAMNFERLYVRVFLEGDKEDWQVTTNKAGLHDTDEAALSQAVFDSCKDVLHLASSEAIDQMHDNELVREIENSLTAANKKHAKRGPRLNSTGTKVPTGNGSEHEEASKVHKREGKYRVRDDAESAAKTERERITIHFSDFDDENEHLYGKVKVRDRIIRLNKRHPAVSAAWESKDRTAIRMMAWSLWSDAWTWNDSDGQTRAIQRGDFVSKMSAMLKVNM